MAGIYYGFDSISNVLIDKLIEKTLLRETIEKFILKYEKT